MLNVSKFLISLFFLAPVIACAETYQGRVVGVADGDTVTVVDGSMHQHKVRLVGIDAPEKAQPFGNVSRQHLARLVFQKHVTIEFEKRDRYQRELGKVLVAGQDANLEQLKAGLAWHYKKYEREQSPVDRKTYSEAEANAAIEHRGLWQERNPISPWRYRKNKRAG